MEQKPETSQDPEEPTSESADVPCGCSNGSNLLYTWRRQMLAGEVFWGDEATQHLPVVALPSDGLHINSNAVQTPLGNGIIEIALVSGVCVRVDKNVDGTALRRVLDALQGR